MTSNCRNCGEPVSHNYCPSCGQATDERRGPFFGLLGDVFSEFLSLDGRHLRTAKRLLIPGKLTELYLAGKRASHVTPVRVYFVATLIFFFLVSFDAPDARGFNVTVDGALVGREEPDPEASTFALAFTQMPWADETDKAAARARTAELQNRAPQELLDRFFRGLERSLPTALILFVPLLALGLKLLYIRSPIFYVEHLVFSLHFQSFLFVALTVVRLANSAGLTSGLAAYIAVFLVLNPIYLTLALRRVFGQSWIASIVKALALVVLYPLLLVPVFVGTMSYALRSL